jgi:septal ring factor EnvC (AmiA/AmiB activator)
MYLIFTLVLGLLLFIVVYAKYIRVVGSVSRRAKQFEEFEEKMQRHIQGVQDTNAHLKAEIRLTRQAIERLEKRVQETAQTLHNDSEDNSKPAPDSGGDGAEAKPGGST